MSDFTLDPANYEMKRNPAQAKAPQPALEAITAAELEHLQGMSREELIALIKRLARQCGLVAAMTPKETAQAIIDRLAEIVLQRPRNGEERALRDIISACNSWLDRVEGRPKQTIEANVNMSYAALLDEINDKRDKIIDITPSREALAERMV